MKHELNPTRTILGERWKKYNLQSRISRGWSYRALLDPAAVVDVPLTNMVNMSWTTLAGVNPDERSGEDGAGGLNSLVASSMETVTPTDPVLLAEKTDSLAIDADSDGVPSPGDTLAYSITLQNNGNADVTGLVFSDTPDPNTILVVGSVITSQGMVTSGNVANDVAVEVDLGTLAPGNSLTISFQVQVPFPFPGAIALVSNQGVFTNIEVPDQSTDDPDQPGQEDR